MGCQITSPHVHRLAPGMVAGEITLKSTENKPV